MIYLFYTTIAGHNYELAQLISDQFTPAPTRLSVDQPIPAMTSTDLLIVTPATTGAGEPTADGRAFYQSLAATKAFRANYWVAGIGDAGFGTDFAGAVSFFDAALSTLGGHRIHAPLRLDYELTPENSKLTQAALAKIKRRLSHA